MLKKLWNDETGVVISAELALVTTIAVLGSIVGVNQVVVSVNEELKDMSNAIGAVNQSFGISGFQGCLKAGEEISYTAGSGFIDGPDVCDDVADIVSVYVNVPNSGG